MKVDGEGEGLKQEFPRQRIDIEIISMVKGDQHRRRSQER
jgi:hypothetical protein